MDLEDSCTRSGSSLETVRALHQTIVALRTALEESKTEILELKQKSWPIESVQNTLTALSIENHVLKRKIIENNNIVKGSQENFDDIQNREELQETAENGISLKDDFIHKLEATESRSTITKPSDIKYNLFGEEPQYTTAKYFESKHFDTEDINKSFEHLNSTKFGDNKSNNANEVYDLLESQIPTHNNLSKEHIETHCSANEIQAQISKVEAQKDIPFCNVSTRNIPSKKVRIISPKLSPKQQSSPRQIFAKIEVVAEKRSKNKSKSLESLTVLKAPANKKFTFTKTISFSNLSVHREFTNQSVKKVEMGDKREDSYKTQVLQDFTSQNDLEQEVDDIELIFTTDDTDGNDFKEELVPIDERESNSNLLQMPLSDYDQISDRELDDDVFNDNENHLFNVRRDNSILNSKSDNSINHEEKSLKSYYSYQDSSFEKSFENKSLEKDESFDRFEERVRIVETDMSKVGIQELEYVGMRRNTCPNPIQYRPLSHRDAMAKGVTTRKTRPILTHSNAMRRESEAQTDISAIPGTSWRSESSLAHKVKGKLGENFTTLPSKIPLPGSRLRLSEKTVEARRVLLSDIGFTSMVPELSRSADHLCPGHARPPSGTTYGQFLRATDLYSPNCASQKFTWTATTNTPSDVSQSQSRYSSVFPLYSPPAPSRRCSAPVSPSRRALLKPTLSKVRFANGSLPELRSNWSTLDSGDSTDSLVEEAENYLRRSIDCIVTGRETVKGYSESKRTVPRRASAPEPCRDNVPPMGWQPFLPRLPRDLKLDNWVKVITPEGKVRGGRIRYVGLISSQGSSEHFIGVQLACPEGVNDGTWGNRRYFQCEPYHGIFVPFKKVIMGWRP